MKCPKCGGKMIKKKTAMKFALAIISLIGIVFISGCVGLQDTSGNKIICEANTSRYVPNANPIGGIGLSQNNNDNVYIRYPQIFIDWSAPNVFTNYCSMSPTFCTARLVATKSFTQTDLRVGDIIIFNSTTMGKTVHRIISMNESCYTTKGDFNTIADGECVKINQIVGKVIGIIYGGFS